MRRPAKFVVVHNGSRDGYQVAAALAEAGLLECLVTDLYAPAPLTGLAGFFARRRHPAVPYRRVRQLWRVFAAQAAARVLRLPLDRVFAVTDQWLARDASRIARRRSAGLLCYGSYVPPRSLTEGLPVIDFEYHPHPGATFEILARDHALYPETTESFAREEREHRRVAPDDPWRRAGSVICASSMTRRSLEFAGADPARISVVPYGMDPAQAVAPRPPGDCRFLFVGQGIQRKGLHHLIRAWQTRPRSDATLTLVCYRLDPAIAALIIDDSIQVLSRRSPEELADLYRQADVFVMPSLVEGFGLVYLEALAHGCHVIGTTNTGLPDLDLGAEAATIIEPGEIPALDLALTDLVERKRNGAFDPQAIANRAARWSWADFRREIAASVTAGGAGQTPSSSAWLTRTGS